MPPHLRTFSKVDNEDYIKLLISLMFINSTILLCQILVTHINHGREKRSTVAMADIQLSTQELSLKVVRLNGCFPPNLRHSSMPVLPSAFDILADSFNAKLTCNHQSIARIQNRVQAMIDEGKDLDAIVGAKPTAEFDKEFYGAEVTTTAFLGRVDASLTRE